MMPRSRKRLNVKLACLALSVSLLGGCATASNPRDPFEPVNRGIYQFNETLDDAILKPVARGYRFIVPQFVRSSVSNFFSNINDVVVLLNNLLQGKFTAAYTDFGRIAMNSTIGILGLFDVASEAGIEKHEEDFGQTLGVWGIGDGPFLMLPFFGPSTVRDAAGRVVDYYGDLVTYVDPTSARNIFWGTRIVNRRAELLDASTVLQTAALDPYEFVRDAYLQRRRSLIHDGSPPPDRELFEPEPAKAAPKSTQAPFPIYDNETGPSTILATFAPRVKPAFGVPLASIAPPKNPPPRVVPAPVLPELAGWKSGEALTPAQVLAVENAFAKP